MLPWEISIVHILSLVLSITCSVICFYIIWTIYERISGEYSSIGDKSSLENQGIFSSCLFRLRRLGLFRSSMMPIYLLFCDSLFVICTISMLVPIRLSSEHNLCYLLGPLSQFFSTAAFIWATSITRTSFNNVLETLKASQLQIFTRMTYRRRMSDIKPILTSNSVKSHIISWSSALFGGFIFIVANLAKTTENSICWITPMPSKALTTLLFLLFIFPFLLMLGYNIYVLVHLRRLFRNSPVANDSILKLVRYIIVTIIVKGLFLLSRMIQLFVGVHSFWLLCFSIVVFPLQGLGDCFIFWLNQAAVNVLESPSMHSRSYVNIDSSSHSLPPEQIADRDVDEDEEEHFRTSQIEHDENTSSTDRTNSVDHLHHVLANDYSEHNDDIEGIMLNPMTRAFNVDSSYISS